MGAWMFPSTLLMVWRFCPLVTPVAVFQRTSRQRCLSAATAHLQHAVRAFRVPDSACILRALLFMRMAVTLSFPVFRVKEPVFALLCRSQGLHSPALKLSRSRRIRQSIKAALNSLSQGLLLEWLRGLPTQ